MADDKKKDKPALSPINRAAQILQEQARKHSTTKKKADEPEAPEGLPDNWGIGDLVRVGKSRLSHAVFGPPPKPRDK
jgi:hypothetical protein